MQIYFPYRLYLFTSPTIHLWDGLLPILSILGYQAFNLCLSDKWKIVSQCSFLFLLLWVRLSILTYSWIILIFFTMICLYLLPIFIELLALWLVENLWVCEKLSLFCYLIYRYYFPVCHLSFDFMIFMPYRNWFLYHEIYQSFFQLLNFGSDFERPFLLDFIFKVPLSLSQHYYDFIPCILLSF